MEILNSYSEKKLAELFDFLGFISIYDDRSRTDAYMRLMRENSRLFQGACVVEAGAGFGIFSRYSIELGARKAYSVEVNRYMVRVLSKKLADEPENKGRIIVVKKDITEFKPREDCDVLVHELFGPLLYDESLNSLENLIFKPKRILPDGGCLRYRLFDSSDFVDEVVSREVLFELGNALVTDLFEIPDKYGERSRIFREKNTGVALLWSAEKGLCSDWVDISHKKGDLLCFCLEILDGGKKVLSATECTNWPLVWTVRLGEKFRLGFRKKKLYHEPDIFWG